MGHPDIQKTLEKEPEPTISEPISSDIKSKLDENKTNAQAAGSNILDEVDSVSSDQEKREAKKKIKELGEAYKTFDVNDRSAAKEMLDLLTSNEWIIEHLEGNELGEFYHMRGYSRLMLVRLENGFEGPSEKRPFNIGALRKLPMDKRVVIVEQLVLAAKDFDKSMNVKGRDSQRQRMSQVTFYNIQSLFENSNFDFPKTKKAIKKAKTDLTKGLEAQNPGSTVSVTSLEIEGLEGNLTVNITLPDNRIMSSVTVYYDSLNQRVDVQPGILSGINKGRPLSISNLRKALGIEE